MRLKNITAFLSGLALAACLSGCDGEKDLVIIEGNLPIKTSTLYLVGDATPNGWSIDQPTAMVQGEDDPLVFTWQGPLKRGEMKLCLTTGSWDAPFIRPVGNGDEIGRAGVAETEFKMYAGDPDNKWKIVDAGVYDLTFDLRGWTMSATYVGELEAPVVEPIETDVLYIVGDATPAGWNIGDPTVLEKTGDYLFVYEGPLVQGEMKACIEAGSWDVAFIRPESDGCAINGDGVAENRFVYAKNPDDKWKVEQPGIYRLTFDLEHWTIAAEYTGDFRPAPKLYMIGEATAGGWSWDSATEIESTAENEDIFVWEGELGRGSMKAAREKDFTAPFYRPATNGCEISASGVASGAMVFTESPDDQWMVTVAGRYRLTFNTADMTFDAEYLSGSEEPASKLYMIGEATAGGWSWDSATEIESTADNRDIFVWEGELGIGSMKAAREKDFTAPFYRPSTSGCEISASGVASGAMVFTESPDDQWMVTVAGRYRLTFNTADMTFDAEYLGGSVSVPDLYMIGSATSGGWSLDDATRYSPTGVDGEYTWTGHLSEGTFKACTERDFMAPFYRPSSADVEVSASGVAAGDVVYTTDPDHQWKVTAAGTYTITINIKAMTISAKYH